LKSVQEFAVGFARSQLSAAKLALQLPFCFEVRALSCSLVGSAPEGPSDDVRGFDPRSMKSDGNAADFLE
jgi:hypothetical protein